MPIRGIVFDLFHTLTAKESEWSKLPWTSDFLGIDRTVWNHAVTQQSRRRMIGEIRDPTEIVRTLAHGIDPGISEELIKQAAVFRQERFRQALQRIPSQNVELLSDLRARGFRLALLSNADASEVASWPSCPLAGLFDVEVFSCWVGSMKPEKAIYSECLRRLGLAPAECIFVGDGGSDELVGAREAGLYAVFCSGVIEELWPERIPGLAQCADFNIRSLSELLSLPILAGAIMPIKRASSIESSPAMQIRSYRPDEWPIVREIYDLSKPDELRGVLDAREIPRLESDPEMLDLFAKSQILVMEKAGAIVGFGGSRESSISWLFVHPKHRREGIATAILRALLAQLTGTVTLNVVTTNVAARALYERMGFAVEREFSGKFKGHECPVTRLCFHIGN